METVFPFGFPFPTAFYLTLFVLTLVVHVAFMNYVLAGTAYLACWALTGSNQADPKAAENQFPPTAWGVTADWMPFMLSGAIAAGIAPLLFVQILYKQQFYTANLLLFNRWMAILPVLIIGFYMMYLIKSAWLRRRGGWLAMLAMVVPFLCAAFVAYSWTENHLVSVLGQKGWEDFYKSEWQMHYEAQQIPRLLVWAVGSIPTWALLVGWQLTWNKDVPESEPRKLALIALSALGLTLVVAVVYELVANKIASESFFSAMGLPYFLIASVGVVLTALGWFWQLSKPQFQKNLLMLISAGSFLTILGMSACREVIRIRTLGEETMASLYPLHERAAQASGIIAFLVFTAINAVLIVVCVLIVRTARLPEPQK